MIKDKLQALQTALVLKGFIQTADRVWKFKRGNRLIQINIYPNGHLVGKFILSDGTEIVKSLSGQEVFEGLNYLRGPNETHKVLFF